MTTWREFKKELNLSAEEQRIVELEMDLIRTLISIREQQGLTQAELAQKCNVKQPVIARMEKSVHSPQVNSLLRLLAPLGYTLKIAPIEDTN